MRRTAPRHLDHDRGPLRRSVVAATAKAVTVLAIVVLLVAAVALATTTQNPLRLLLEGGAPASTPAVTAPAATSSATG